MSQKRVSKNKSPYKKKKSPSKQSTTVKKKDSFPIESAKVRALLSKYKQGTPPLNEIMKNINIKRLPTQTVGNSKWGGYKDRYGATWHKVSTIDGENYFTDNYLMIGSEPWALLEAYATEEEAEKQAEKLRKNVGISRYGFMEQPWRVKVSKAHGMTKHGIRRLQEKSIMPKNFVEFYAIYRH